MKKQKSLGTVTLAPDTTYNGWTNYETWNVKLWIDNDQGSYNYWRETAKAALLDAKPAYPGQSDLDAAAGVLSVTLRDEILDGAPDLAPSMYSDILSAALRSVNWYEIAQSLLSDLGD